MYSKNRKIKKGLTKNRALIIINYKEMSLTLSQKVVSILSVYAYRKM